MDWWELLISYQKLVVISRRTEFSASRIANIKSSAKTGVEADGPRGGKCIVGGHGGVSAIPTNNKANKKHQTNSSQHRGGKDKDKAKADVIKTLYAIVHPNSLPLRSWPILGSLPKRAICKQNYWNVSVLGASSQIWYLFCLLEMRTGELLSDCLQKRETGQCLAPCAFILRLIFYW